MLKLDMMMTWDGMKKECPGKWVFIEVVEGNETNFIKDIV